MSILEKKAHMVRIINRLNMGQKRALAVMAKKDVRPEAETLLAVVLAVLKEQMDAQSFNLFIEELA